MSKDKSGDEIRYCERCGISFLWSREEQKAARSDNAASVSRPDYCSGCRELLAGDDRERGLVKWFNHQKRYGFIVRSEAPDLFVHKSAIARHTRLRPGDLVEFSCAEGTRGEAAKDVILLMRESKQQEDSEDELS